ncbi:MAG: metallophosphoesterase, partial [Pseudomonadota bacterium]|nr:metallophosphoesterase [Pseudomonadota bacterium]
MRTLLHLSDLHFGRIDASLLDPLCAFAGALDPDLVVVSGDLTQRARTAQFEQARQFLDTLPRPQIVVPGNHDVPLHNLISRFANPRGKFQRIITPDVLPTYVDGEIGVVGINTSRSLTLKGGRINTRQIGSVFAAFNAMDAGLVKIVVSHHPFDLPDTPHTRDLVGRAPLAMEAFARCGVDLLLAGHLHTSQVGDTA